MSLVIIPVDSVGTYYEFETRIDGNSFRIVIRWNTTAKTWHMDLIGLTTVLNILGIGLIPGVDILAPFAIIELGSMYIYDTENKEESPTRDSLGKRHLLLHISRGDTFEDLLAEL